jgi:uridine kinase
MKRAQLLDYLIGQIIEIEQPHPVRVAIDGPDAAGKTTLAEELAALLQARSQPLIRASIDGFHHPARVRHQRGATSPDGYYHDSFNYRALTDCLLVPLGPSGSRHYRSAVFDYHTDSAVQSPLQEADPTAVLLFDGVFLQRPELREYWDFTVFVTVDFEVALDRAKQRDGVLFGGIAIAKQMYKQRYIPGQKLYFAECRPAERADVVIDNNDPSNPAII